MLIIGINIKDIQSFISIAILNMEIDKVKEKNGKIYENFVCVS